MSPPANTPTTRSTYSNRARLHRTSYWLFLSRSRGRVPIHGRGIPSRMLKKPFRRVLRDETISFFNILHCRIGLLRGERFLRPMLADLGERQRDVLQWNFWFTRALRTRGFDRDVVHRNHTHERAVGVDHRQ